MSIISIINGTTPCNFINNDNELEIITLKYIDSKYYIKNFCNYENEIKCKLIKNQKIIKSWAKNINVNFDNSFLFEFKLKVVGCLITKYYSYVIEINKNHIDEFGLLSMNIFQVIPISSFYSKLLFINTFTSQF